MFISIRGTSGSGKTYLVRQLLQRFPNAQVKLNWQGKQMVIGYQLVDRPLFIVGNYSGSGIGGVDRLKGPPVNSKGHLDFSRLRSEWLPVWHRKYKNLLLEGLTASSGFLPWWEFSRKNGRLVWCYLDTPLKVCNERLSGRNKGAVLSANKNLERKWLELHRQVRRVQEMGLEPVTLRWKTAFEDLLALLTEQGIC